MALAKPPKSSIDRRAEALIDKASAVHSSKGMSREKATSKSQSPCGSPSPCSPTSSPW